jgi:tripartite-type tricarboxylate transporter receptor subunit TctC
MVTRISRRHITLAGLGGWIVSSPVVAAEDYPSKPVKIIVPYPPGGFNDTLARTVADKLTRMWKLPVVVDNRPGGNTVLANQLVAKSPADGYTMLISPLPFSALPALYSGKLPYDSQKDFQPLIWAGNTQNALVINNDRPIYSVKELIDYAKKNPGKLNFSSTGSGSSNHLSMELFMSMTGTKMTHVPYKGSAPAVSALLAGEVDVLFDNVPNIVQHVRAGKMRALGVTSKTRTSLLPDIVPITEAGVPGYEINVWFGMQMPAGVPIAYVEKANRDIATLLREPDVVAKFRDQGVEVVASTPAQFGALITSEIAKWTKVVNEAGVKLD